MGNGFMLRAAMTTAMLAVTASIGIAESRVELLRSAGDDLGRYYRYVVELTDTPTSSDDLPSADDCDTAVKAWKAKGVKDADRIFSYDFNRHPKAKDNTLALSEMSAICGEYRPLFARYRIDHDLRQFDGVLMRIRDGLIKPGETFLTASVIDGYEKSGDPAGCKAAVAAATGADAGMSIRTSLGKLTLPEYDAKVCDELGKVHPQWVADARAALRKAMEAKLAPYIAAGIGGKKLELVGYYDGVYWRLVGGKRTDDPRALAKSNILFQWLEAEDRDDPRYVIHTIRRYRFKGNDLVGVSEKQYRRKKGSDVGNVFK